MYGPRGLQPNRGLLGVQLRFWEGDDRVFHRETREVAVRIHSEENGGKDFPKRGLPGGIRKVELIGPGGVQGNWPQKWV